MKRLRELRELNKMTQQELADFLGVSANTIGQYERGSREPNINNLIMLANQFDVSVDYLVENDIGCENLIYVSNEIKDLIETISNFDADGIKAVESFVKVYKDNKK